MTTASYPNRKGQQLTLELLRLNIPVMKDGEAAAIYLNENKVEDKTQLQQLLSKKRAGEKAQEELLFAALPLIKSIASKEFQRRRNWQSRVSYDDIMQEAMMGFIRGLQSFNIEATNTSPTNYLGQWITVSIRRRVEAMDHDFAIPYEMVERHRRIRAVRARLANTLAHDPTDEELLEALNSSEQDGTIYKWGKVEKSEDSKRNKIFTQKHIDEYREVADKTYGLSSYEIPDSESENGSTFELSASPLHGESKENSYERLEDESLSAARLSFFNDIFIDMRIGSRQKDVILRFFGLDPYDDPQLQKEIVEKTGFSAKFIKAVIEAFSMYMPLKGGVFHKKMVSLDSDEVESMELAWLIPLLGEWPIGQIEPIAPPEVLTQNVLGLKNDNK
jgi:DNA-directed RNA polymerase specialized sigma subunit